MGQGMRPVNRSPDNTAPTLEVDGVVSQGGLDQVLADLPPLTRAVVLLRFRDNVSCKDIAEQLQLTDRQVRRHLTRAYEQLRKTLAP